MYFSLISNSFIYSFAIHYQKGVSVIMCIILKMTKGYCMFKSYWRGGGVREADTHTHRYYVTIERTEVVNTPIKYCLDAYG
jgi:hypothetical protein